MQQSSRKRLSLDALDGAPRSEHPPVSWRNDLVKNALRLLVMSHMTVEPEINPRKIRELSKSFEDEFLRLERNVLKDNEIATWDDCRRVSLGLIRILKGYVEEILEK